MTPNLKNLDEPNCQRVVADAFYCRKLLWSAIGFCFVLMLAVTSAFAQAATEYGSATSGMATSMSGINLMNKVKFPDTTSSTEGKSSIIMSQPSKESTGSPHYILNSMKKGSVRANRKDLEKHAGKNASKLMLRSSPSNAYVKIDGKAVGRTPILLVLAPGHYDVTMDGKRMEHAEQKVDLLPKETREFLIPLKQLFPTEVMIHLH